MAQERCRRRQALLGTAGRSEGRSRLLQHRLQRRIGGQFLGRRVQRLSERARRIDAIDLGSELARLLGQLGVLGARGPGPHRLGIGRLGAVVDLDPQLLETRVAVVQRRGQVAHLLRRRAVGTMRQQASTRAQRHEAVADPGRLAGHADQQSSRGFALVLFLHRAAVVLRLAQDPAVVGGDQELLDQPLRVGIGESRVGQRLVDIEPGQDVGDQVALGAHLARPVAPLAMLPALALAGAGEVLGRQHTAVAAEPLDAAEGAAWLLLHLDDPALVLRRRAVGGGRRCRRQHSARAHRTGQQQRPQRLPGQVLNSGHRSGTSVFESHRAGLSARRSQPSTSWRIDQRGPLFWVPCPSTQ